MYRAHAHGLSPEARPPAAEAPRTSNLAGSMPGIMLQEASSYLAGYYKLRSCLRSCVRQQYPKSPTAAAVGLPSAPCLYCGCAVSCQPAYRGSAGLASTESEPKESAPG